MLLKHQSFTLLCMIFFKTVNSYAWINCRTEVQVRAKYDVGLISAYFKFFVALEVIHGR